MRGTKDRRWIAILGFACGLSVLPGAAQAQRVITDEFGTQYLVDALPSDLQSQVMETQQMMTLGQGGEGPLAVDGRGRFALSPDSSQGLSEEILLENLTGIVLVPTPGEVNPAGVPGVQGIWHDYDDFPIEVGRTLEAYLGRPVSLASLDEMVRETIKSYRTADRPVVDVLLPEQDITEGVVQLVVVESTLGRVRVEGVSADREDYLRGYIRTKKGEILRTSPMQNDLYWLNKSPYRKVDLVYAPGYEFGTTDVILKASESDPVFFYAGYENSGTELLGEDRLLFGAHWGDAFGPDKSISYQLTTDMKFQNLVGHSLIYSGPLPWRHYLTALASYVDVNASVGADGETLDIGGENYQGSLRYAIPLPMLLGSISQELEFGFDYKSSNNNLEFGGAEVFDTTTEIYQFSMGYNLLQRDDKGVTQFDLTWFHSPGRLSGLNSDDTFEAARTGASSEYDYVTASIERQQLLREGWYVRARAQGQMTNENLLASEQLGIGGYDTVRGFEQRVTRGDEGLWGSFEIYSPPVSIGEYLNWENETDELRFLAFYDHGVVSNVELLEGEPGEFELQSVGLGLRWYYSDWFRLRVDYGVPIGTSGVDGIDTASRWHVGATANF